MKLKILIIPLLKPPMHCTIYRLVMLFLLYQKIKLLSLGINKFVVITSGILVLDKKHFVAYSISSVNKNAGCVNTWMDSLTGTLGARQKWLQVLLCQLEHFIWRKKGHHKKKRPSAKNTSSLHTNSTDSIEGPVCPA